GTGRFWRRPARRDTPRYLGWPPAPAVPSVAAMHTETTAATAALVPAGGGRRYELLGNEVVVKLDRTSTDGRTTLIEYTAVPGFPGPPLHTHAAFDEVFVLLGGRLSFRVEAETFEAGPGDVVFCPGAVPHTFANASREPARFLVACTPGGFEHFLADLADLQERGALTPDAVGGLWDRHGMAPA